MGFFNSISFGYKVMLIGIVVFVIGVIIMFIESRVRKRRPEDIKKDYLVKNNVRTSENPSINNGNSMFINSQTTNDYSTNLTQQRNESNEYPKISEHNELNNNSISNNTNNNINSSSELMDLYK